MCCAVRCVHHCVFVEKARRRARAQCYTTRFPSHAPSILLFTIIRVWSTIQGCFDPRTTTYSGLAFPACPACVTCIACVACLASCPRPCRARRSPPNRPTLCFQSTSTKTTRASRWARAMATQSPTANRSVAYTPTMLAPHRSSRCSSAHRLLRS